WPWPRNGSAHAPRRVHSPRSASKEQVSSRPPSAASYVDTKTVRPSGCVAWERTARPGASGGGDGAATVFHDHSYLRSHGSSASLVQGAHMSASRAAGRPAPSVVGAYSAPPPAPATATIAPARWPGRGG